MCIPERFRDGLCRGNSTASSNTYAMIRSSGIVEILNPQGFGKPFPSGTPGGIRVSEQTISNHHKTPIYSL